MTKLSSRTALKSMAVAATLAVLSMPALADIKTNKPTSVLADIKTNKSTSVLADIKTNKSKAVGLLVKGLVEQDRNFINKHVAEDYIQHNPQVADKRKGLLDFVSFLEAKAPDFSVTPVRILGEDNLVMVHSKVNFFGPKVIIDLFRFEDGKIVEHWDAIQEEVTNTVSGRTMTDGPTEPTNLGQTAASKEVVVNMVKDVLMSGKLERIDTYIAPSYKQHNPFAADTRDGLKQFIKFLGDNKITFGYSKLHNVVAEGDFVFTQAEGIYDGKPTAF